MLRRWLPVALALAAGCGDKRSDSPRATSRLAPAPVAPPSPTVTVAGTVIDLDTREAVPGVEVVLRGEHGDVTAQSKPDGTFDVVVPRGSYRAFVRDARVISTGLEGRRRLRGLPRAELAGVADEQLMPLLVADGDVKGVELGVTAAALVEGVLTDPDGNPVENAVVHAVQREAPPRLGSSNITQLPVLFHARRPVLGTDTVISDDKGTFLLRLPAGRYVLEVDHPSFAGVAGLADLTLDAGARTHTTLTLARGCIISGKVIGVGGTQPNDGALEVRNDVRGFGPSGRINADGTFRWTTTDARYVEMRAWPWQSAPSPEQSFWCDEGIRYDNVVLRAGNELPDLAGTMVDAEGNPVPLAYFDIAPLDGGANGQQERVDASGSWRVFELPAGRYEVTANARGRGVVSTMVVAPRKDLTLALGGTGRLSGTTTEIVDGTFEMQFHQCGGAKEPIELEEDTRLVVVRGGRFTIDDVPACGLTFTARWRDHEITGSVVVEPERTAYIELELGGTREKVVRGTVRDSGGAAVGSVRITALVENKEVATGRTEKDGTFELRVPSGAELVAGSGRRVGRGTVGRANVASERVDIVLDDIDDGL
jgi:hypothetical protein